LERLKYIQAITLPEEVDIQLNNEKVIDVLEKFTCYSSIEEVN
jgi:hypothetical protein